MMDSEQIFHPGFWFVLLGLLTAAFPFYIFVLWKSWKLAVILLLGYLCFGVYFAFYSARNFGGVIGIQSPLKGLSAFSVTISIVLGLWLLRPFRRRFERDMRRSWMYALGGLIVVLMQLLPLWGNLVINIGCFRATQRNAAPLITAVKSYQQQYQSDPADLNAITPTFLPAPPELACSWISGQEYRSQFGYELVLCPDGGLLLINLSMDGSAIERYQFSTDHWSSINLLAGACNDLP